ncbi:MAG: malto-oligosyltrehalose synthase [Leptospirales bacterium]
MTPMFGDLEKTPTSTYRMGFHLGFRLSQATRLLPYLEKLGISALYASPLFAARTGSVHGYDIIDPTRLNPEVGSSGDLERLAMGLSERNMGMILDIVPNHMAAHFENSWWRDLLENGEASPYSMFFDIDWTPPQRSLMHRISLPILGAPYGKTLENRELLLEFNRQGFVIRYWDKILPLDPATIEPLLHHIREALGEDRNEEVAQVVSKMEELLGEVARIPSRTPDPFKKRLRTRTGKALQRKLWTLYGESLLFREALEKTLVEYNGIRGLPGSFDRMDDLLSRQVYWLSHWKTVTRTLNYRRFFDVADLVGVRAGDERVFAAFHSLPLEWYRNGWIDGLRIDHIDGLLDPSGYLSRLSHTLREHCPDRGTPLIWVEKILSENERLDPEWPVAGTTGYEFANMLTRLFGDPVGVTRLRQWYSESVEPEASFRDIVYFQKKFVAETLLGGELRRLTLMLETLAQEDRYAREMTFRELQSGIVEVTACLGAYRTYVRGESIRERDRELVLEALGNARRRHPNRRQGLYRFFERILTLSFPAGVSPDRKQRWIEFVRKWQQFSGPVVAKGMEDTAFYLYGPLISFNEVGGDPCAPPVTTEEFHQFNRDRLERFPFALSASSTHDTKRSEDVRARIQVLSEYADRWPEQIARWSRWNRKAHVRIRGMEVPDPALELFVYQTLIGAWPFSEEEIPEFSARIDQYLVKVARESKRHSNWISPDTDYEEGLVSFGREILRTDRRNPFLSEFLDFHQRVSLEGAQYSLSQLLLKMASPGVPDFYQGTELWDFSLVDPDNRRPVDYSKRIGLLDRIEEEFSRKPGELFRRLLDEWQTGAIKLFLTWSMLRIRKSHPALFSKGSYLPLPPQWEERRASAGFFRIHEGVEFLVVVPTRVRGCLEGASLRLDPSRWEDGKLPLPPGSGGGSWTHVFSGATVETEEGTDGWFLRMKSVFGSALFSALIRDGQKRV